MSASVNGPTCLSSSANPACVTCPLISFSNPFLSFFLRGTAFFGNHEKIPEEDNHNTCTDGTYAFNFQGKGRTQHLCASTKPSSCDVRVARRSASTPVLRDAFSAASFFGCANAFNASFDGDIGGCGAPAPKPPPPPLPLGDVSGDRARFV